MFQVIEVPAGDQLDEPAAKEASLRQGFLGMSIVRNVNRNQREKPAAGNDQGDVDQWR